MADMTPLEDILNGDPADATDVQANFQTIEAYINGTDLVRTDGTEVMTADLDLDSNKIVNLTDGTAAADAVNKGQLDAVVPDLRRLVATRAADQTLSGSSSAAVSWTAESLDTDGWLTPTSTNLVCPTTGVYLLSARVTKTGGAGSLTGPSLAIGGTTVISGGTATTGGYVSAVLFLTATDVVTVAVSEPGVDDVNFQAQVQIYRLV